MEKTYGYMRVSTEKQNDERQFLELCNKGIEPSNIYSDKLSGKDFNRKGYQALKRKLKKDDILMVKSLDRLGRNYKEIVEEWRYIVNKKGANIVVLDMPLLDTRKDKDLIGTLISDIVLGLLSYVAQQEREFIKQRQAEGIAIAKAKGVKFGRPFKELPPNFDEVYLLYLNKNCTRKQAAQKLDITLNQFIWLHRNQKNNKKAN